MVFSAIRTYLVLLGATKCNLECFGNLLETLTLKKGSSCLVLLDSLWLFRREHCVLPACKSISHMNTLCPHGQKRVLDPLELILQMVVRHHVGSGD